MNITDEMLYAAAPEAAERWLDTLPKREDCGHGFSLTFEASMAPILRRRRKRRWKTLALLAAVIAALGALLASGAVAERPDSYRVYAAQEDGLVSYSARPKDTDVDLPFQPLIPGWTPEGFLLDKDRSTAQGHAVFFYYSQEDPEHRNFRVDQWHGQEQNGLFSGKFILEDVEVDGEDAVLIYCPDTSLSYLLWTQGNDVFLLSAKGLEREDLFRIAENMKW
ncbi:MAG: DUF4367 domain-containing protein [Oscillibacter sp.]|nr:DUF4367 domain-containing protein [Oscillibacter sp.]